MRSIASIAAIGIAAFLMGGVSLSWAEALKDSAAFLGEIPKSTPTYSIKVGNQSIFGAIEVQNQFTDTSDFEALGKLESVTVVYDTPWAPDRLPTAKNRVELGPWEPTDARLERLKQGWKESGYEIVEGVNGWQRIRKGEPELLERAQTAAAKVYDKLYPPVPEEAATAPPPEPGFLAQYGWHVVVLVAALLSLAVVLKGMVFR